MITKNNKADENSDYSKNVHNNDDNKYMPMISKVISIITIIMLSRIRQLNSVITVTTTIQGKAILWYLSNDKIQTQIMVSQRKRSKLIYCFAFLSATTEYTLHKFTTKLTLWKKKCHVLLLHILYLILAATTWLLVVDLLFRLYWNYMALSKS